MNLKALWPNCFQGVLAGGTCHIESRARRFVLSVGDANVHVCRPIELLNLHAKLCMLTTSTDRLFYICESEL